MAGKKGMDNSGKFKPGVSGNPNGKPKLPDDLKHLLQATGLQVKRDLLECYNTKLSTLRGLALKENEVSAGLAMIASCMVNAVDTGDNRILSTFLDRLIGKPSESEPHDDDKSLDETKSAMVDLIVKMATEK